VEDDDRDSLHRARRGGGDLAAAIERCDAELLHRFEESFDAETRMQIIVFWAFNVSVAVASIRASSCVAHGVAVL
jgi:hypothetical protein